MVVRGCLVVDETNACNAKRFRNFDAKEKRRNWNLGAKGCTIRNSFVPIFQMCAYTRKCIAPVESSLNNHRFDQAVVSLLISYYGVPFSGSKYRYHPVLRRDGGNKESFLLPTLHNLLLKIQDAYSIRFNNSYCETRNITYTKQVFKYISRPLDKEWP